MTHTGGGQALVCRLHAIRHNHQPALTRLSISSGYALTQKEKIMSKWVQSLDWTAFRTDPLAQWKNFYQENQQTVQTVGIVALAGATGTVFGVLLGKGLVAIKSAAVIKAGATHAATTLHPVTTTASLQNAVTLLNNTAIHGATLVDKITALLNTISTNAVPLTAGAVGGGAVGVGVVQNQVRQVQEKLDQQIAQTTAAQAETVRIQAVLRSKEGDLAELQAKLAPATPPADDLEAIHGIGKVIAQRLNAAGIYTFAELAAQTPQQLRTIIGTGRSAAMMNPEAWIAEAQQRVAGAQNTGE